MISSKQVFRCFCQQWYYLSFPRNVDRDYIFEIEPFLMFGNWGQITGLILNIFPSLYPFHHAQDMKNDRMETIMNAVNLFLTAASWFLFTENGDTASLYPARWLAAHAGRLHRLPVQVIGQPSKRTVAQERIPPQMSAICHRIISKGGRALFIGDSSKKPKSYQTQNTQNSFYIENSVLISQVMPYKWKSSRNSR